MRVGKFRFSVALALALAVAAVSFLWISLRKVPGRGGMASSGQRVAAPVDSEPSGKARASLSAAAAALGARGNPEEARKLLAGLRESLGRLPADAAASAVVAFLDEGADAPTGLEFSAGSGGTLAEAPSLRVFLLDFLPALDASAADHCGAKVLETATSPDEWAIALRNHARSHPTPEGSAFLRKKAEEMIRNPAWLERPSAGFLEAFDVFVHTRDTAATPLLAKLARDQEQRAAAHAAYLTLDRLVIAEPRAVFAWIGQQPGLFKGRELMQANFFARADVRDGRQRMQVESYLLDSARSTAEIEAFAGIYPNANYMISENLLTRSEIPVPADLAARDQAALQVTDEWLADPRFQQLRPHLQTIRSRLQQFVPPATARPR